MTNFDTYLQGAFSTTPELKEVLEFQHWLKNLGLKIAQLRKAAGLTQKELAERLGVSQSVVGRIESGYNVTCSTLWKLSMVLQKDLSIFEVKVSNYKKSFSVDTQKRGKTMPIVMFPDVVKGKEVSKGHK